MDVWEFPTPIRAEVATHARIPIWLSQIIAVMHFTKNQVISKKLSIIKNVILMFDTINAFNNLPRMFLCYKIMKISMFSADNQ